MDAKLFDGLVIRDGATLEDIEHIVRMADKAYALKYERLALPMHFFEQNEEMIRKWMRANHLRAIYRGPRPQRTRTRKFKNIWGNVVRPVGSPLNSAPSMTRRENATAVAFYRT